MTPLREVIYNAWNRLSYVHFYSAKSEGHAEECGEKFAGGRSVREKLFSRSPLLQMGVPFVTTRVWSVEDFDVPR